MPHEVNLGQMLGAANRVARSVLPAIPYQRLRKAVVARRIASYKQRTVSRSYCGFPLRISLGDPVAEEWYDREWPRSREVDKLSPNPGEVVFDLGAHQAVVAMVIGRLVGETGHVIAVEAEPHNVRAGKTNVALNGATNVEVIHAAVTSEPGSVLFAEGLNGRLLDSGRLGTVRVPAVTIDSLAAEYGHPDAVLIDVEGAEVLALEGASETIRRGARFMIEVHLGCGLEDLGGHPDELPRLLTGYRFETSKRDVDDGWQEGAEMSVQSFLFAEPAER